MNANTYDDSLPEDAAAGPADDEPLNNANLGAADDDDDDSALDLSEQTQRPNDTALLQQRVLAWQPILDPVRCDYCMIAWEALLLRLPSVSVV